MSDCDLCSAVFVLHSARRFDPEHFQGRAAHKLFLIMLGAAGFVDLAAALHDLDAALPFTVSPIFQSAPEHFWIRFTGLSAEMCATLNEMADRLRGKAVEMPARAGINEQGWILNVEAAVLSHHDWAGMTILTEFIEKGWILPRQRSITLEFATPVLLKSVGLVRPFPEPALIFKLLYGRWLKLGAALPFQPSVEALEGFLSHLVEFRDYEISCKQSPLKKSSVATFTGWASYTLLRENPAFQKRAQTRLERDQDSSLYDLYQQIARQQDDFARLLHLLAEFAFYSGLGSKTAQGMGMIRKIAAPSRGKS